MEERYRMKYLVDKDGFIRRYHNLLMKKNYKEYKKADELRILGKEFVEKNRNKARLVINNKKYHLQELFGIDSIKEEYLYVKLILNQNISDRRFMFKDCQSLIEFVNYDEKELISKNEILKEEEPENIIDIIYNKDKNEHPLYKNVKDFIYFDESEVPEKENPLSFKTTLLNINENLDYKQIRYINF